MPTEQPSHHAPWWKRMWCRIGIHPRPAVLEGTWPYPITFTCEWCGRRLVDHGPEH